MKDSEPTTQYWALLIGINFYTNPTEHLEGCVHDVDKVKAFLSKCPFSIQIRTFTATVPVDSTSRFPLESKCSWPTFDNITTGLREITDAAEAGDFVYIHYSGHGAQTMSNPLEYGNHETGDLALILFDELSGRRYFRGLDFAQRVNRMVEKGLLVNIVLDCCFSASAVRTEDAGNIRLRATRYGPVIITSAPLPTVASINTTHNKNRRDVFTVPSWLIDTDGYTILTACGPHERAIELRTENGLMTGALTHFLLLALTSLQRSGVEISQQSLYSYLLVQFQLHRPSQNPVLFGNGRLSFFGKLLPIDTVFVSLIWRDHQLLLEAGEAHGVCNGDEYTLSPIECPETGPNRTMSRSIKAFVNAVGSLTSVLTPTPDQSEVDTGWKAELITPFSLKETTVRIAPNISNDKSWLGIEKANRSLKLHACNDQPRSNTYMISINKSGNYEILDQDDQILPGLPVISKDEQDSGEMVINILNHISRFKSIENIENRVAHASFKQRFAMHMEGPDGRIQEETGVLNINDSERVKLVVRNNSSNVLYAYVYHLSPSWGIKNIFPGANHWSIPPKNNVKKHTGTEVGEFEMFVPDHFKERNYLRCRDVFKIFLTSRPIPFTSLEMAELCGPSNERPKTSRGDHSEVISLLLGIRQTSRGSEAKALVEEWTSHNFIVHTFINEESP